LNIKFEDQKKEQQQMQNQNNQFLNNENISNVYCPECCGTLEWLQKEEKKQQTPYTQNNCFLFKNFMFKNNNFVTNNQQNYFNVNYNLKDKTINNFSIYSNQLGSQKEENIIKNFLEKNRTIKKHFY
jgi:hypothetical protein